MNQGETELLYLHSMVNNNTENVATNECRICRKSKGMIIIKKNLNQFTCALEGGLLYLFLSKQ